MYAWHSLVFAVKYKYDKTRLGRATAENI
jgi:hypothetical protein